MIAAQRPAKAARKWFLAFTHSSRVAARSMPTRALTLRAELMVALRKLIAAKGWTQARAAEELGVTQSRVSDLVRGKHEKFSLDMLVTLAARAGRTVKLRLAA